MVIISSPTTPPHSKQLRSLHGSQIFLATARSNPWGRYYGSSMIQFFSQIQEPNFQTVQIQRKEDIWPSFKTFLTKDRVRDDAA